MFDSVLEGGFYFLLPLYYIVNIFMFVFNLVGTDLSIT